jgi:hypothetical protein
MMACGWSIGRRATFPYSIDYDHRLISLLSAICYLIFAYGENDRLKELVHPLVAPVDPGFHRWEAAMVFDF